MMVTAFIGERRLPPPPARRPPPYALWGLLCAVLLVIALCLAYDGKARYAALSAPPATACVVAAGRECVVRTQGGDAVGYWVGWSNAPGLATVTPKAGK